MRGRNLNADAGGVLRNNWIAEGYDVDALLQ